MASRNSRIYSFKMPIFYFTMANACVLAESLFLRFITSKFTRLTREFRYRASFAHLLISPKTASGGIDNLIVHTSGSEYQYIIRAMYSSIFPMKLRADPLAILYHIICLSSPQL